MLKNIPNVIRNPMDLDSHLPKTVYCLLGTKTCEEPRLYRHLPAKIRKSSYLVSFNIMRKNPKCQAGGNLFYHAYHFSG